MSNVTPVLAPLHLAFPVHDIATARTFYGGIFGYLKSCSSPDWVSFNFYGHQIVAHLAPDKISHHKTSAAGGDNVPVHHFGVVLSTPEWEAAANKLRTAGIKFIIESHIRFKGKVDEQATMFSLDPSDNATGIKTFASMASLLAK